MKKFIGVLIGMFAFVGNAFLLCCAIIIGMDLINRKLEEKKCDDNNN